MQVGCFVPADSVKMHVVDAIHTRMGASDDISRGRSTFLEVCFLNLWPLRLTQSNKISQVLSAIQLVFLSSRPHLLCSHLSAQQILICCWICREQQALGSAA